VSAETTYRGEQADAQSAARHSSVGPKSPCSAPIVQLEKLEWRGLNKLSVTDPAFREARNVGSHRALTIGPFGKPAEWLPPFAHYDQTSIHGSNFTASTDTRSHRIDFVTDASLHDIPGIENLNAKPAKS